MQKHTNKISEEPIWGEEILNCNWEIARGSVLTSLRVLKTPERASLRRATMLLWGLPLETLPGYYSEDQNSPLLLPARERKKTFWNIHRTFCFSEQELPSSEITLPEPHLLEYYQNPTDMGGGKYPAPASSSFTHGEQFIYFAKETFKSHYYHPKETKAWKTLTVLEYKVNYSIYKFLLTI